jgi:type II secretory pathway component PulM
MPTLSMRNGPMAAVERQLEVLSPRDRKLLVGLVLSFVLLATAGFWYVLHGQLETKASRVRAAKESYETVSRLEQEYRAADAQFTAQKDRLQEYSKQPLQVWLEQVATKYEILPLLTSVRSNTSETVGDIVQTHYTVDLKKAPQEQLYRFLHEVETSGFPAKVQEAVFKVSPVKNQKMMDLQLEIVVLSLAES